MDTMVCGSDPADQRAGAKRVLPVASDTGRWADAECRGTAQLPSAAVRLNTVSLTSDQHAAP
jgi:hypothetical protein